MTVTILIFEIRPPDPVKQINFSLRCVLTCDASWVQVAKFVHHMNSTRNFAVKVDARNLPEGVHATRWVPHHGGRMGGGWKARKGNKSEGGSMGGAFRESWWGKMAH